MRRSSSYLTRFLLLLVACVLLTMAVFFVVSDYLTSAAYSSANLAELREAQRAGALLLNQYTDGRISLARLRDQLNPTVNTGGVFLMLLSPDKQVIAYSDGAVPYFAGSALEVFVARVEAGGVSAMVSDREAGAMALIMGEKVSGGYVLSGMPARASYGAATTLRGQMLLWMPIFMLAIVAVSTFATRTVARPARVLIDAANRIKDGEQLQLPEDMPGEMSEIARAFNYMSGAIAKAFQELRYEKETMALIIEGLNEGILAVDGKGRVLNRNSAARRLLGGEDSPAYQAVMEALRGGRASAGKTVLDGHTLQYTVTRLPARDESHAGSVALIRDITEQERLERTRYDYVANISHELRTPLASMRGLAEGLRDGLVADPDDRQRYYNIIVDEVTRLARLVNDLLELSGLQSNPAAFEMERVDPNELIYDLHDRNGSLFKEKHIAFERALPDNPLPDIRSNEDRLAQVLTIFLDNARKYTKEGGTVTIGAKDEGAGVRFFVRDTGIGMDEETKRLAFDRFHQAERGRSDKGSGLGLSIAREIMQKLGVEIDLESQADVGSEFSFLIPYTGTSNGVS